MNDKLKLLEELEEKIKLLHGTVWDGRGDWAMMSRWLSQFEENSDPLKDERLQMLFLASHFMYFGMAEIRELLRSLFRDSFQYNLVENIRKSNGDTTNRHLIRTQLNKEIIATKFMGVGNPSESGSHLLYYFRQENSLPKTNFMHTHEIFTRSGENGSSGLALKHPDVRHYVFLDDLCGSGQQAESYSRDLVAPLKSLDPTAKAYYYTLFATSEGIEAIRKLNRFDHVGCVVELDPSFRTFGTHSRVYANENTPYDKTFAKDICERYGRNLFPGHPLGYRDGQLLIAFAHNTPDNTLPVFWYNEPDSCWFPVFRRYPKIYGW